ncbi:MAG: hypothetical protein WDA71_14645 [Actinomycetota bacterium]
MGRLSRSAPLVALVAVLALATSCGRGTPASHATGSKGRLIVDQLLYGACEEGCADYLQVSQGDQVVVTVRVGQDIREGHFGVPQLLLDDAFEEGTYRLTWWTVGCMAPGCEEGITVTPEKVSATKVKAGYCSSDVRVRAGGTTRVRVSEREPSLSPPPTPGSPYRIEVIPEETSIPQTSPSNTPAPQSSPSDQSTPG